MKPFSSFPYVQAIIIIAVLLCTSCSKSPDRQSPVAPPTTPPQMDTTLLPTSTFNIDSKWRADVDGVTYMGTVDTSFVQFKNDGTYQDTVVDCNGTSNDKKAIIHFRIIINRTYNRDALSSTRTGSLLVFDTSSSLFLQADDNPSTTEDVIYHIDTLKENKLQVSFNGTMIITPSHLVGNVPHTVTNGKFTCEFGKGNSEPDNFTFNGNGSTISGFFSNSELLSNSLVMYGIPYAYGLGNTVKLIIRTGGTIKPGVYNSNSGDGGLIYYTPSIYPYYIDATGGSMSLTITSVDSNVVHGYFSGINYDGKNISGGVFNCRVHNYIPEAESQYKWGFSEDDLTFLYNCYGGNMQKAISAKIGSKYFLTVNGKSDNDRSVFKIVVSSTFPITPGLYQTNYSGFADNHFDSLNFVSPISIGDRNNTQFHIDDRIETYCRIDSIDNYHVSGIFYGKIRVNLSDANFSTTDINFGTFHASF